MHELVKIWYKVRTTHITQLYKKKNGVRIARTGVLLREQVFLFHELENLKKGAPNARTDKNLIQRLYDTYYSTLPKINVFPYFPNRCSYCTKLKKKTDVPNAWTGNNFIQSLYDT